MKKKTIAISLLLALLLGLLPACGDSTADTADLVALGGFSTIYEVDTETNAVLWTKTYDCSHTGWLQDGDTVYIGTDDGTIRAVSATSGDLLWEQATSFASPFQGLMDLEDGTLYYSGAATEDLDWPIYALDLETMEATALPVGTGVLTNFSVVGDQLYACNATGVTIYDLTTGETTALTLEDQNWHRMSLSGSCLTVAYDDRIEWYTVSADGMTVETVSFADMFLEEGSLVGAVVAANEDVAIVMDRNQAESHVEATLYAWLRDSQTLVPYHTLTDSPGYITFTDNGFYALWRDALRFYDYEGEWTSLL